MTYYNPNLKVPFGYSRNERTLAELRTWLLAHHHPEFVERLIAWLNAQGGKVGVGGGWRPDGTQPDKPGFAPEGKSFHQNQKFSDGFIGAAAVDLVVRRIWPYVWRAPQWSEVPAQGSAEAAVWGVHCNISTESWHMQFVPLDGWQSWVNAGCFSPRPNYPFPGRTETPPPAPGPLPTTPTPAKRGIAMNPLVLRYGGTPTSGWAGYYSLDGGFSRLTVTSMHHANQLLALGAIDAKTLQRVTSWNNVTHTNNAEELDEWLTPGRD